MNSARTRPSAPDTSPVGSASEVHSTDDLASTAWWARAAPQFVGSKRISVLIAPNGVVLGSPAGSDSEVAGALGCAANLVGRLASLGGNAVAGGLGSAVALDGRQAEGGGGAGAVGVVEQVHGAVVAFDDGSGDRQPEAGAGDAVVAGSAVRYETVEEALLLVVGDADAGVGDRDDVGAVVVSVAGPAPGGRGGDARGVGEEPGGDGELAVAGAVLDGVAEEVVDDLPGPVRVGVDDGVVTVLAGVASPLRWVIIRVEEGACRSCGRCSGKSTVG